MAFGAFYSDSAAKIYLRILELFLTLRVFSLNDTLINLRHVVIMSITTWMADSLSASDTSILLIVVLALLLIAAVALAGMLYHHYRQTLQKNQSLMRQVAEAMAYEHKGAGTMCTIA